MAYSEEINSRIASIISGWRNTSRKKMFGGICHLLNGNMVAGVYKDFLILRLGEKGAQEALKSPHARPFDITGKAMKGWVMVKPTGFRREDELEELLNEARDFVTTLPVRNIK